MDILMRPVLTEKTSAQNEVGKYVFVVNRKANKLQVRKAVEETYKVSVLSVNTATRVREKKSRYTRKRLVTGFTSKQKRAIVTVKQGDIIDFFDEKK